MNDIIEARFWSKVEVADCWYWTGATNHGGYGVFSVRGEGQYRAHRLAWELLVGPCPEGLQPDHVCRTKHCVNPDHLEWVTASKNCQRRQGSDGHMPCGHSVVVRYPYGKGCRVCTNRKRKNLV